MIPFAALALSAAILMALPPSGAAKTAPRARSGGDGGGVAASSPQAGGRAANVSAIGAVAAEILQVGTNAPPSNGAAADRRVRETPRGGMIDYQ